MSLGYVYDPIYLEHDTGEHPENASRLVAIMDHLRDSGLLERMTPLAAEPATMADLRRVHHPEMIAEIARLAAEGGGEVDLDTIVGPRSYDAALYAAGGTTAATRAVLAGQVQRALVLARPPGHHATPRHAMGFCLFNNVAIAAAWALAEGGVARLAIVDFDVHHGNGTQIAFAHDPRVLFISTHQYPHYPGSGDWDNDTPLGAGGHCLNIPLPAHTGDIGYRQAFERLVIPAVRRFRPDLLLVSAGYDGHWGEAMSRILLSLAAYHELATTLVALADEFCQSRLMIVLEGGYHLQILPQGVASGCCAMLGLPYTDPFGPARQAETDVSALVERIATYHRLG